MNFSCETISVPSFKVRTFSVSMQSPSTFNNELISCIFLSDRKKCLEIIIFAAKKNHAYNHLHHPDVDPVTLLGGCLQGSIARQLHQVGHLVSCSASLDLNSCDEASWFGILGKSSVLHKISVLIFVQKHLNKLMAGLDILWIQSGYTPGHSEPF